MRYLITMTGLALLTLALAACSPPAPVVKQPSKALPPTQGTPAARYVHAEADQHQGESGFRLLMRSTNALMSRVSLADHAKHSLDLQYYIFDNDATGRLMAQRLLAAADRGVRVRLLVDDINASKSIDLFDALDTHPNIEVRLFNPFATKKPSLLSKAAQFMLDMHRLNRRMHNKSFIADANVAIIGGRNIGDAYFDAGENTNFRDLDLIAIGPVVQQAEHAFDEYWNCAAAYPVKAFAGKHADHYDLAKLRVELAHDARKFAQSDYAQATLSELPNGPSADRPGKWFWGPATLVADQPAKIEASSDQPELRIGPDIKAMTDATQHELLLISPYFIPGDRGTAYLDALAQRGVTIKVLTNSLASDDEPIVYAGYSRYRRPLLEHGVQLYELQPATGAPQPPTVGGTSSGVSLHAKAIVVDRQKVFIGSMNMDARSKLLNTEMGIIVDSPALAEAVTAFFDTATQPQYAYHVTLKADGSAHGGTMQWQATEHGKPVTYDHDPGVTTTRRVEVQMLKLLPVESLL
ncbi:phosphatidylserine/phosphatidylglycerophosphate/cardiolipin synthase family protein [Rhodanobacter sp. 115]|uniref:phospholipase D-like domain-containing protein n=1 Tax=Rhodanobacter sp. FW021-MT20 TaxID=1162282 RepID=UPI0034E5C276